MSRAYLVLAFAISISLLLVDRSSAAEIRQVQVQGKSAILIKGMLDLDDGSRFQQLAMHPGFSLVLFDSPGGHTKAGLEIGRAIRFRNYDTAVPSGSNCYSSCAVAFLGGVHHFIGTGAHVGFHAIYDQRPDGQVISSVGNALVGAYYSQLELSDEAIEYLTMAQPQRLNLLTPDVAARYRIALEVVPENVLAMDAVAPAKNTPFIAPPIKPLLAPESAAGPDEVAYHGDQNDPDLPKCRDFIVQKVLKQWNTPGTAMPETLWPLFADQVQSYGHNLTRTVLRIQVNQFASDWPSRAYAIEPGSLTIVKVPFSNGCAVTANLSYIIENEQKTKRIAGRESWQLALTFNPMQIISEAGDTLEAKEIQPPRTAPALWQSFGPHDSYVLVALSTPDFVAAKAASAQYRSVFPKVAVYSLRNGEYGVVLATGEQGYIETLLNHERLSPRASSSVFTIPMDRVIAQIYVPS